MLSDCTQSSCNRLCGRDDGCPGFYQSTLHQESSSRGERRLQLPHSSWGQSNKATFQRAKSKRQKETQNVQSLQHCRQSGRLLKIAGNRHTAGSQRQKAGRFPREQPQKPTGSSFLRYTKLLWISDFSRKKEKKTRRGSPLRFSKRWYREIILGLN